jgi:hypothetical protein
VELTISFGECDVCINLRIHLKVTENFGVTAIQIPYSFMYSDRHLSVHKGAIGAYNNYSFSGTNKEVDYSHWIFKFTVKVTGRNIQRKQRGMIKFRLNQVGLLVYGPDRNLLHMNMINMKSKA